MRFFTLVVILNRIAMLAGIGVFLALGIRFGTSGMLRDISRIIEETTTADLAANKPISTLREDAAELAGYTEIPRWRAPRMFTLSVAFALLALGIGALNLALVPGISHQRSWRFTNGISIAANIAFAVSVRDAQAAFKLSALTVSAKSLATANSVEEFRRLFVNFQQALAISMKHTLQFERAVIVLILFVLLISTWNLYCLSRAAKSLNGAEALRGT